MLQTLTQMILFSTVPSALSFGSIGTTLPELFHHTSAFVSHVNAGSAILHDLHSSTIIASASDVVINDGSSLLVKYRESLALHPLQTKMVTGGILAVTGDAIAQSRQIIDSKEDEKKTYDVRRAFSFAVFDMCYRALQQFSFPTIAQNCQGQTLGKALSSVPLLQNALSQLANGNGLGSHELTYYLSALEQTITFQFGIVPLIYYPVFFILTGSLQGLTPSQSFDRARETFIPLMKRNLLFWIPVQFGVFSFVDDQLQIPILCVSGLAWTIILSIMAGSAKSYASEEEDSLEPLYSELDPDYMDVDDLESIKLALRTDENSVCANVDKNTIEKASSLN